MRSLYVFSLYFISYKPEPQNLVLMEVKWVLVGKVVREGKWGDKKRNLLKTKNPSLNVSKILCNSFFLFWFQLSICG
jgi:hypothetical protein